VCDYLGREKKIPSRPRKIGKKKEGDRSHRRREKKKDLHVCAVHGEKKETSLSENEDGCLFSLRRKKKLRRPITCETRKQLGVTFFYHRKRRGRRRVLSFIGKKERPKLSAVEEKKGGGHFLILMTLREGKGGGKKAFLL